MKGKIIYIKSLILLCPMLFISDQIRAYVDEATQKFSRNQSQFEESISNLNFKFSDDAVLRLQSELDHIRENREISLEIKRQLEAAQSQLSTFKPGPDDIDFDFSSLDFTEIRHDSEEERTDEDGLTFPSIQEWFSNRRRDWGLLGYEIMNTYAQFFAENKPSPESFNRLIEQAIKNIISKGHFVWFNMRYPESKNDIFSHPYDAQFAAEMDAKNRYLYSYSETIRSFRNKTIDAEKYYIKLVNQVLLFFSTDSVLYQIFTADKLYSHNFSVRVSNQSNPIQFQDDYFPLLNQELRTLFRIEVQRRAINRALKTLKDIKIKEADHLSEDTSKVSKQRYRALKKVFKDCYDQEPDLKPSPTGEELNLMPFFIGESSPILLSFETEKLPAFVLQSYYHPDLYCRTIGVIFRQVYIENELEIFREYVSKGNVYKRGIELREELKAQLEKLKEAEVRLVELQFELQEENDKDNRFWLIKKIRGGTDPDKLESIQAAIDKTMKNIQRIRSKKDTLVKSWKLYKDYNHLLHKVYLEDLEDRMQEERRSSIDLKEAEARLNELKELASSNWYWLRGYRMASLQSIIAKTEKDIRIQQIKESAIWTQNRETQQISKRLGVSEEYIQEFENLLADSQEEYKQAESQLASFSSYSPEDYKTAEAEWVQAATDFFEGLRITYQEYEHRQEIREQIIRLQSSLENFEEEKAKTSPLRERYLELKIKVISDLRNNRPPKLEDVFNGFLLRDYQPFEDDVDSFHAFRSSLNEVGKTGESSAIDSFKVTYEKNIADHYHDGQPLLYHVNAASLAHPILENRIQCYSGSFLFYVLTELAGLTDVQRFAIFTNGHILPGILSNSGDELYGIETTAKKEGLINFGSVSEVSGNIRVVELYPFLLIEFLKYEISNFPELYADTQDSLKKYGFSIENLHPLDDKQTEPKDDILNDTPFGFGSVDIHPVDLERKEIDDTTNDTPFGFSSVDIHPVDLERKEIIKRTLSILETFNRSWSKRSSQTPGTKRPARQHPYERVYVCPEQNNYMTGATTKNFLKVYVCPEQNNYMTPP